MTPREVFARFVQDMETDSLVSTQLAAWSEARRKWRAQWNQRTSASPMAVFRSAVPGLSSGAQEQGSHPVAEHAPELSSWRAAWLKEPGVEQNDLAEIFVRAVALIDSKVESLDDACAILERSTLGRRLPLATLSTAASSLHPSRFVVLCDAWLSVFHQDAEPAAAISAYPALNADALRWLADAEGDALPPALSGSPRSDRLAVYCSWVARTNRGSAEPKFDVTQKKYKDWPPMW